MRNKLGKRLFSMLLSTMMVFNMAPSGMFAPVTAWAAENEDEAPAHAKTLTPNGDGSYTLSLSVTGSSSSTTVEQKANVLLVIDTSGSMDFKAKNATGSRGSNNGGEDVFQLYKELNNRYSAITDNEGYTGEVYYRDYWGYYYQYTGDRYSSSETRMDVEQSAIKALATELLGNNTAKVTDKVELAYVTFAGYGSGSDVTWYKGTSAESFNNQIDSLNANGGTNWDDGLHDGKLALDAKKNADSGKPNEENTNYIVFISDGQPTYYMNSNHSRRYGDGSSTTDNELDAAYDEADTINAAGHEFYGVGVFGNVTNMQDVVQHGSGATDNYYSADDEASLKEAFANIINAITDSVGFTDVKITDGVTGLTSTDINLASVDADSFTYTRSDGKTYDGPEATYENDTVTWDMGDTILDDGVTYTVSFVVWPSQDAYDLVADLNNGIKDYDELSSDVKGQIVKSGNTYSLKTNTINSLNYKKLETKVTGRTPAGTENPDGTITGSDGYTYKKNADGTWTGTKKTAGTPSSFTNPSPMGLAGTTIPVKKEWEGGDAPESGNVVFGIYKKGESTSSATVTLNNSNQWASSASIAPGVFSSTRGLLEVGHDYVVKEESTEGFSGYQWEFSSKTVHPMLVDGVLTIYDTTETDGLVITDGEITNDVLSSGDTAAISGTNNQKSDFQVTKKVVNKSDRPSSEIAGQLFTYKIKVNDAKSSDGLVWFSIGNGDGPESGKQSQVKSGAEPSGDTYFKANNNAEITVQLLDGENVFFTNLSTGTTYSVQEIDLADGYTITEIKNAPAKPEEGETEPTPDLTTGTASGTINHVKDVYSVDYTNTYTEVVIDTKVNFGKKTVEGTGFKPKKTFEFSMIEVADANGTALSGAEAKTATLEFDAAGTKNIDFGELSFYKAGTYYYQLDETTTGTKGDGWTYDETKPIVTVTVAAGSDGKLTATVNKPAEFKNSYKANPTKASFPVKKVLSVPEGLNAPDITGKFTFTLAGKDGAPMPEATSYTNPDKDGGTVTFGDITYTKPGTYTYTVTESGAVDGVTNDTDAEKTVTVTVKDNGDGTLTATADSTTASPVTFTNTYSVKSTAAKFPVKKILSVPEGMTGPEKWSYTIDVAANNGAPAATTMTGTVDQDNDTVTFGDFTYTAPGIYTYTVTESGTVDGVTNDTDAEKTVTVTVKDNGDGTMTASPSSAEKNPLTFTNTYDVKPTEITLEVEKKIENRDWEEGETYEFELLDESGEPLGTASASNANPVAAFAPITYTAKDLEKGKFTYTIREIEPDQKGEPYCYVTYDEHKVIATVTLTDNGYGTMNANVTYEGKTIFTNVYEVTDYSVKKTWDDADNRLRIRPDDLTVTVYAMISGDMLFSREVVLNDSNDWTMKLENLPAKWNGIEIEYIAEEAEVTGYSNATASDAKRMEFVNTTDTGDLSIKKFVNKATEEFDKNDTTDYDFTVTVETEDTETFDQNVTFYTAKANSSDGETTGEITFRNGEAKFTLHSDEIVRIVGLPAGATYKVEESVDASRNYDPVFFNNEGTIIKGKVQYVTFINRELDERTLKVQKSWENDSDFAEYRPEKITVDIYKIQGDEEKLYAKGVDLLKTNGYAVVFNLDGCDAVATVSDATRSSANTSASTANAKKASASTASSSSASFSDAAVADAFDEDGNLKDGTIFDDLFTVVKDAVKEAAGKIGTLFGIDDDTEISFRVEETKVPDHYKVAYDEYDTENHILTFTNTREDANKVWIDPPVEKIISVIRGTITRDETFTFRMTQLNGTTMFPKDAKVKTDDDGYPYMELKITGEGEKEFGKIYYDKVGTYVYEITEINTGASNYSYSTDSFLVTAEVTADRDKLVENVTVVKNGTDEVFTIKTSDGIGGDVLGIQFVNTYDAGNRGGGGNGGGGGGRRGHTPSTPAEPGSPVLPEVPVPGALPKTGESSGKAVPMLFAMLAMFGALFGFKKRDDEDEQ